MSALAYRFFISESLIINGGYGLLKIFLLWDIPGHSEFLLAFSIVSFISFLFFDNLKKLSNQNKLVIVFFCLAFCFMPLKWVRINQLGLIIGSHKFTGFPVIQYLPFFLIGTVFAKEKFEIKKAHFFISMAFSLTFLVFYIYFKELPRRFPPHVIWILGSSFFIYLYYIISKFLNERNYLNKFGFFVSIGASTLFYLIVSNLLIFALKSNFDNNINLFFSFLGCIGLTACIYYLRKLIRQVL